MHDQWWAGENVWARRALSIAVGIAGALAFESMSVPLPWLLGPMFACMVVSIGGAPVAPPGGITTAFRTTFGVAIGASFTPALLDSIGGMALSLALLPLYVAAIALLGYPFFRRICGFDQPTAFYSAMPGGLPDMVALGADAGADLRMLSLVHATRILIIVSVLPFVIESGFGIAIGGEPIPGAGIADFDPAQLAIQAVCALAGWRIAQRLGITGASIVGPMTLTAVLSMAGVVTSRPPVELILAAQLLIGVSVGVRYAGVSLALLARSTLAAAGYTALLALLAALFMLIDWYAEFAPPLEAILAFAPGGQAEMTVIAIVAGADVAFVAVHHVLRVFIVVLGGPLAQRWLFSRRIRVL